MECPVCFDPYDLERHRPKVLWPCGHSVCKKCLLDPAFGKACPQDRTPIQGKLAQLPDCMAVINIISQGNTAPRSSIWCRDCEKDFTGDCSDAGHRSCSKRQLRTERIERIAPHVQAIKRGAAAGATLEQHLEAVSQDIRGQLQAYRADQRRFKEAQGKLEAAAKAISGLKQAMDAAELLLPRAEQLEESASLAGLRGRCGLVVQAEDGAEWRASVALEDGRRQALRHALLELRSDGDLTKVGGTDSAPGLASIQEGRALNLAEIRREMSADRRMELLQSGSLKQVRSLTGVDCAQDPKFCELLLQAVTPHLEELELLNPQEQHMEAVKDMPFLRKLSVCNSNKGPVAKVSQFPVNLQELCVRSATLEHMRLVRDLTALKTLDICCADYWENAPNLPLQLEELSLRFCSKQHALSIQRMPRLRRLFLSDLYDLRTFNFSPLLPLHCGFRWLKLVTGYEVPVLSLIRAHCATLQEIELLQSSHGGDRFFSRGLAGCFLVCGFPNLQRLLLLRRPHGALRPQHSADTCRQQVRELRDALLRRDATNGVVAVAVVCDVCDEGAQL